MFDDGGYSVMREAGVVVDSVDDGEWWIEALRGEVQNEESRRRQVAGDVQVTSPRAKVHGQGKKKAQGADCRLDALRSAHAKIQAKSRCGCGRRRGKWTGSLCPACYERERKRKFFKFDLRGREVIMEAVQSMAALERRSVSEMLMVLVTMELDRRLRSGADTEVGEHQVNKFLQ